MNSCITCNKPLIGMGSGRTACKPSHRKSAFKLSRPDGNCEICSKFGRLYKDHNHINGQQRGLLCPRCNGMLAGIEEKTFFHRAVEYLQKYKGDKNI